MSKNVGSPDDPKVNIEDILDVVPRGHIIFKKVEEEFRGEIIKLTEWYSRVNDPNDKDIDQNIPYQYQKKNQTQWITSTNIITKLLSHIDPVIMEKYKELYLLEKGTPEQASEIPVPITEGTSITVGEEQKKEGGLKSIFGMKSKRETDLQSPYRVSLEPIKAKEQILEDWYDLVDYHSYGLIWVKFNSIEGMEHYLDIEVTEFKRRVQRLVTAVNEGINLALRKEKEDAVAIITTTRELEERHRLGNQPNQQNLW